MSVIRKLYQATVSPEVRFWLYKLRNRSEVEAVRSRVYQSPKGDFSLRRFDQKSAIFVHVPKAAGTSVALALFGELPYHYSAWQYRVIFGRRLFKRYFKFSFVRNPWDRLYSAYSYLKAGGWNDDDRRFYEENLSGLEGFEEFVLAWLSPERLQSHMHFRPQHEFVCDRRGRIMLDFLGYFETLQVDFDSIAERIGVASALGQTNSSPRAGYREVYTPASRERVAELYRKDIQFFGYDFSGIDQRQAVERGRLRSA